MLKSLVEGEEGDAVGEKMTMKEEGLGEKEKEEKEGEVVVVEGWLI